MLTLHSGVSGCLYMKALPAMKNSTPAQRKYTVRTLLFMSGYVAANAAALTGAFDDMRSPGTWFFALAVAAPVAGQIWATLAVLRESDEFVRHLMAKRFIVAGGVTIALFSAWGFMETYAQAPHAPGFLVYALFWLAFGSISPFIHTTH